jgi:hypothetical protein
MSDRKRYSIMDEFGGERLSYVGTHIEIAGDCVKVYDVKPDSEYLHERTFPYLKAAIRLAHGWSVSHTEVYHVGLSTT